MARQSTDQLYIELDYYYPEEFYVYTAEAQSAQSAESTVDAVVGKVYDVTITCDALFTPTLTADAFKNHTAYLESNFTLDATAVRLLETASNIQADFAQTVDNSRTRDSSATLDLVASCEGFAEINSTTEAHAHVYSEFATEIIVSAIRTNELDFYVTSVMAPDGVERIRDLDSTQAVEFNQFTDNVRTRDYELSIAVEFVQTTAPGRIQEASVDIQSAFSPSMTVNVVTNTFAVLDSTSALTGVVNANRSADIALASIINLSSQGDKFVGYAVDAHADFAQTADNVRTRNESATISADFATNIVNDRTRDLSSSLSLVTTQTTDANRLRADSENISAVFSSTIVVNEIVQLNSSQFAQVTATVNAGTIKQANINCGALFAPSFNVNAVTNTFAVLDAVTTATITAVKTPANTVTMSVSSTQTTTALRIKQLTPFTDYYVEGVEFTPASSSQPSIGDPWITVLGTGSWMVSAGISASYSTNKFLISFWARNPNGAVLQTEIDDHYLDYTPDAGITFVGGDLVYIGLDRDDFYNQYRSTATYDTNSLDNKWNHYIIYNNQFTEPKVYKNGVEITPATTSGPQRGYNLPLYYGGMSAGRGPILNWSVGYKAEGYENPNGYSIIDKQFAKPYQGALGQMAIWYNDSANSLPVPNAQQSNVRARLFNEGFVNLGITGTDTGLRQPEIYLRLEDYLNLINNQGSLTYVNVDWKYIDGNSNVVPEYNNKTYYTVGDYLPQASDASITPNTFQVRASMTISSRASNSGFVDLYPTFTLDVEALKLHPGDVELTTHTDLVADNNKITDYHIDSTAQAQVESYPNRLRDCQATVNTQASLTAQLDKTVDFGAGLNSNFAQSTDNQRVRFADASTLAEFTASTEALRIKQLNADLIVSGATVQAVNKIGRTLIALDSNFALTADAITGINVQAQLSVQTVETTEAVKTTRTTFNQEIRATTQIAAKRLRDLVEDFDINAQLTATTNNSRIVGVTANLTTAFAQTAVNTRLRNPGTKTLEVIALQTLTADNFKGMNVALTVVAQQQSQAVKTVRPQTQFTSIAIELVSGRAITYDRNLTLYIKREYRQLIIPEESTLLKVPEETRVNMVRT